MAEEPLLTIPYFHVCCARLNPQSQNQKWLSIATSKVCPISDPLPMPDQPFIPGQSDLVSTMSKNNLCAENGMGSVSGIRRSHRTLVKTSPMITTP